MTRGFFRLEVCFLAASLCACAESGLELSGTPTETPAPERVVVVAGDGGHLLSFDPATSTFERIGPPAPSVGAYSRIHYAVVSSDPQRMLVFDLAPGGGPEGAFVSDGGEWRQLAVGHDVRVRVSSGLDLLWVVTRHAPPGDEIGLQSVTMQHFDGRVLFEHSERPESEWVYLGRFSRNSDWFTMSSYADGITMHFVDGPQVSLPDEAGNVRLAFDTSMITQRPELQTAHWRDLTGRILERPGFTGNLHHLTHRGPYQLVNGALSLLTDSGVEPLQMLPTSVTTFDLRQHEAGRYVIVKEQDGLTAYAPDGSTFARYDAPRLPGQTHTNIDVSTRLPGLPARYLVSVKAWVLEGDTERALDRSYELWTIEEDGGSNTGHLVRRGYFDLTNTAVTSNAYFFVEDGRLVQVDFADGARREWTHEDGILDASVRQPDLPLGW